MPGPRNTSQAGTNTFNNTETNLRPSLIKTQTAVKPAVKQQDKDISQISSIYLSL